MSMTLLLWKAPIVDDAEEAKQLIEHWCDSGDDSAFEPSEDLQIVYEELLRNYPMDSEKGADPWADGPENTGRLLALSLSWSGDDRILADIPVLAKKFELILYDPQGPDVFLPSDPLEPEPPPRPSMWDCAKGALMVVPFLAATYGAWLIPWGWLSWPLVAIGLFFTAAALLALYAVIAAALESTDAQPGA